MIIEENVTLPAGNLKRIHIDQKRIKANIGAALVDIEPPVTVQYGGNPYKGNNVEILGPSAVVYGDVCDKRLGCGARVWIESNAEVRITL